MTPGVSIIIPAYKEQDGINDCIDAIRSLRGGGDVEVIVVDGSPERETAIALKGRADVIILYCAKGRSSQMNHGACHASGDILLFLHADTCLPHIALDAIMQSGYDCGAFDLGIDSPRYIYRLIEAAVAVRSRLTCIPYGDQAIFISNELFRITGGYRDIPLMEDVDIMRRLKRIGHGARIIKRRVSTSARRWEAHGAIFCTLRNTVLITLYYLGISPNWLSRYY